MTLSAAIRKALEKRFGQQARFDVPMSAHTSLRVGGPADAMVLPHSIDELTDLMRLVMDEGIDWYLLGGGTNLRVRDKGIRGVVISLADGFCGICPDLSGNRIHAESGARLSAVCRHAIESGLSGMGFAIGIPGTIGGAAMMNAGTADGDMAGVISDLRVLFPPERIETVSRNDLDYGYRELGRLPVASGAPILLSVSLQLRRMDAGRLKTDAESRLARRHASQPAGFSAGCFFKNPKSSRSAGELIDRAGLKGHAFGDAVVSDKHANFIINRGGASAGDLLGLMEQVQTRVRNRFEVSLEPEVRIIGEE